MTRFALIAAATAIMAAPSFAQTANETAEEVLNADADNATQIVGATPVEGAVDCMDPAAEEVNDDADTEAEMIECTTDVDGTPAAGEEIFEELEEADDEGADAAEG